MESIKRKQRLVKTLNENKDVLKVVKKLQLLDKEFDRVEMDNVLQDLKLPLATHMFITGNFSDLMELNIR